jgi:hypothetical protein
MANATSIAVSDLTENTVLAQPAGSALDTGTDPVTIPITIAGDTHKVLLEVTNVALAADTMTVKVLAGDNPPALRAGLGDLEFTVAQNAVKYLVLESMRFRQDDGKINITVTPAATKSQTAKFRAFRLPK